MGTNTPKLKHFNTLVVTLLILLIPFGIYYIFYFTTQKSYFTNRDFRLLAVLGKQIERKVEAVSVAYKSAAQVYLGKEPRDNKPADYLKPIAYEDTDIEVANEEAWLRAPSSKGKITNSVVAIDVIQEGESFRLYFNYIWKPDFSTEPVVLKAKSNLASQTGIIEPFVNRFINKKDFEDVIVAQVDDGKVIFQQGPAALSVSNLDALVNKDVNKDFDMKKQVSSLIDVKLADTDYKLFIQPIQLSLHKSDANQNQAVKWVVCGLVRSNYFLSESASVSYTILIVLTFLVLMVALSTPFLKLLFMKARDNLRVADVYFLAFSVLMGSALLTIFLIYTFTYIDLENKMDHQLESFASQITRNFISELGDANREMSLLNQKPELTESLWTLEQSDAIHENETNKDGEKNREHTGQSSIQSDKEALKSRLDELDKFSGNDSLNSGSHAENIQDNHGCPPEKACLGQTRILGRQLGYKDPYPYLNTAFWIDAQGWQRIKWTTKPRSGSFINVNERTYFKNIIQGNAWEYKSDNQDKSRYLFRLEPIYSMVTGGQQVVLSAPATASASAALNDGQADLAPTHTAEHQPSHAWVSAMDIRPLSLLQPVLPDDMGYGYCVIDNDGKVLFHSDQARNLLENFFDETDNNGQLRSIVLERGHNWLNVRYQGVGHRLYVMHINNTPWSLVVFRDKQLLRTAGLELISCSIYLFILYAFVLLIVFGLYYLFNADTRTALIWPNKKRAKNYYILIVFNLILALLFVITIFTLNDWWLLGAVGLFPAIAFLFHHYNLRKGPEFGNIGKAIADFFGRRIPFKHGTGYVLAMVMLLVLMSVLPALAFFKFAYDEEMRLFVGLGQISLTRALEDRAERVQNQYFPEGVYRTTELDDFIKARLRLDNRDVYTSFFFDTKLQPLHTVDLNVRRESFSAFLREIIPFNHTITAKVHGLTNSLTSDEGAVNGLLRLEGDSPNTLVLHTEERIKGGPENSRLHIESKVPVLGTQHPLWWGGLLFLLFFVPVVLFVLINFIGKRIFLLDTDEPVTLYGEDFGEKEVSQNLLVLGSPFTKKDDLLRETKFQKIDLRKMSEPAPPLELVEGQAAACQSEVVVLNYFEYEMDDAELNRQKIKLMKSHLFNNKKVVVVSSTDLMDYEFERKAEPNPQDNGNQDSPAQDSHDATCLKLLSSFLKVYIEDRGEPKQFCDALKVAKEELLAKYKGHNNNETRISRLFEILERECAARSYLQKIGEQLLQEPDFENLTSERLLLKISDHANAYYHAIWSTCSKDEKLTLYYLTKYRLVNSRNNDLRRLLRSGLAVREPHLRPMNETFSRFVINAIHPEKLLVWRQSEESSNWDALKLPFLIILFSAASFLFVSQRELYNSTFAFVSAFAAGMPAVFKFLGFFPGGKSGGAGGE